MEKSSLVGMVLAGFVSILNGESKPQEGWHLVVYEKGKVREV